jgi:hypothetical protein
MCSFLPGTNVCRFREWLTTNPIFNNLYKYQAYTIRIRMIELLVFAMSYLHLKIRDIPFWDLRYIKFVLLQKSNVSTSLATKFITTDAYQLTSTQYIFQRSILILWFHPRRHGISVVLATGYGLNDGGSISGRGEIFFSTPQLPDLLWGPPSLLSDGYRVIFPLG